MQMPDMIPCSTIFSNGTEFEWFMETNCERGCTKYRNGKCKILSACFAAMWDERKFPFDSLLDFAGGYAGKTCKQFTNELQKRKKREHSVQGQMRWGDVND